MMYTPTPVTRRPRPPSRSRSAQIIGKAQSTNPNLKSRPPLPHSSSSSTIAAAEDHFSSNVDWRPIQAAMPTISRASASPADSVHLSHEHGGLGSQRKPNSHGSASSRHSRTLGLGLPSPLVSISNISSIRMDDAEPSPPPPYGTMMPSSSSHGEIRPAQTPLRQDSGTFSQHSSRSSRSSSGKTERSRMRRATNAARAMGLEVDFGMSRSSSQERKVEEAEDLSAEVLRHRLLDMKRQLKRRDNELLLAAEVANKALRTHENLLAYLPDKVKARLPEFVHIFPSQGNNQNTARSVSGSSTSSSELPEVRRRERSGTSTTISAGPMTTGSTAYSSIFPESAHVSTDTDEHDISDSFEDFATADDELGSDQEYSTIRGNHLPYQANYHPAARAAPGQSFTHSRQGVNDRQTRIEELKRADADDRILALEQAVMDARESEECQRKLAARLRKEVDKLQRDFERAETERAQVEQALPVGTPGVRGSLAKTIWRSVPSGLSPRVTRAMPKKTLMRMKSQAPVEAADWEDQEEDVAEPDLGNVTDRFMRSTPSSEKITQGSPALSRLTSRPSSRRSDMVSGMLFHDDANLTRQSNATLVPVDHRRPRSRVSESNFLDPNRTEKSDAGGGDHSRSTSPALVQTSSKVQISTSRASSSDRHTHTPTTSKTMPQGIRRSPWPAAHRQSGSRDSSPSSEATLDIAEDQRSCSPAFASLSSRMASMRAYVSSALLDTPSRSTAGRTLGSELGSDYGDQAENSLRIIEDALALIRPSPARSRLDDDEDGRSMYSDGYDELPAPLPPRVSAALSSLALALAPYVSPHPPRIVAGLPDSSYSEGDESNNSGSVLALRKIRWADTTKSSMESSTGSDECISDSVFTLPRQATLPPMFASSAGTASTGRSSARSSKISPRFRPRPTNARQSSDGSIALAHRRQVSQPNAPVLSSSGKAKKSSEEEDEDAWEAVADDDDDHSRYREPRTIPGKVVHDMICLLAILVDFAECAVVIVYRVILDMRYGDRPSMLGAANRAKMRRYYF